MDLYLVQHDQASMKEKIMVFTKSAVQPHTKGGGERPKKETAIARELFSLRERSQKQKRGVAALCGVHKQEETSRIKNKGIIP